MMRLAFSLLFVMLSLMVQAQDTVPVKDTLENADTLAKKDTVVAPKYWKFSTILGANGTQAAFVNWNGGGQNNVAFTGTVDVLALYEKRKFRWRSELLMAYGLSRFWDEKLWRKIDDRLYFGTSPGYKISKTLYISGLADFQTQFTKGYQYPNDSVYTSRFMAPAYLNASVGLSWTQWKGFELYYSPVASKMTFVRDELLAAEGNFGVRAGVIDSLGNIVEPGEQFRYELGSYLRIIFEREIAKNIEFRGRGIFYSNYLDRPQNIDIQLFVMFNFKVNNWFSAQFGMASIYDDDVLIPVDRNGDGEDDGFGPRWQFKQFLNVGLNFTLGDNIEKK